LSIKAQKSHHPPARNKTTSITKNETLRFQQHLSLYKVDNAKLSRFVFPWLQAEKKMSLLKEKYEIIANISCPKTTGVQGRLSVVTR
jgi:hypothetical protein